MGVNPLGGGPPDSDLTPQLTPKAQPKYLPALPKFLTHNIIGVNKPVVRDRRVPITCTWQELTGTGVLRPREEQGPDAVLT